MCILYYDMYTEVWNRTKTVTYSLPWKKYSWNVFCNICYVFVDVYQSCIVFLRHAAHMLREVQWFKKSLDVYASTKGGKKHLTSHSRPQRQTQANVPKLCTMNTWILKNNILQFMTTHTHQTKTTLHSSEPVHLKLCFDWTGSINSDKQETPVPAELIMLLWTC